MNSLTYKQKIKERLEVMNTENLRQAWLVLKEIGEGGKIPAIKRKAELENKLAEGIRQLDRGEGSDFSVFHAALKKKYGKS